MLTLLAAFALSFVATMCIVRLTTAHAHRWGDHRFDQPQKFHAVAVPRIGGLGVVLGLAAGIAVLQEPGVGRMGLLLLACAAPVFLAGFVQDFTEAVTPRGRLVAASLSAVLAFYVMGAAITYTTIPGLDWLVASAAGSLLLTVFTVAGIANAVNIIDGFNGLASMCVAIMLAAVAYVAFQVNDPVIGYLSLAGIGAVLGFFIWNFPAGLVFLGDGGAYFLGFLVSELSILLLVRNPGEVSPLFPLLVCIYPVFETVFSIYRRRFLRAQPPHMPDGIHLHSLIYRRLIRWAVGSDNAKHLTQRNSMTSPYLWLLAMVSALPAVLFWSNTAVLAVLLFVFGFGYVQLYWRIVRFRAPRWMVIPSLRSREFARGDNRRT